MSPFGSFSMRRYAKRKRSYSKKKRAPRGGVRKAKSYRRRRPIKRRKNKIQKKLPSYLNNSTPNDIYRLNFMDHVEVVGTSGFGATQKMWVDNQAASLNVAAGAYLNAVLRNPQDYYDILTGRNGATDPLLTSRVCIMYEECTMRITNIESAPLILYHYRCKSRRDVYQGTPIGPASMLANGFLDYTVDAAADPRGISTDYNVSPYENPRFCSHYHILRSKRYHLKPSQSIYLKFKLKKPRVITMERIAPGVADDAKASTYTLLNGSTFSLLRAHGTTASNIGLAADARFGLSNCGITVEHTRLFHYKSVSPSYQTSTNLCSTPGFSRGGVTVPLPYVMNHPDSAVVYNNAGAPVRIWGSTSQGGGFDLVQNNAGI